LNFCFAPIPLKKSGFSVDRDFLRPSAGLLNGNPSLSEQDRLSLSHLPRIGPASCDIHTVVIVVKFNFAKGLATPSSNSCGTEAENAGATKHR
jgi:hypothetical protein